MKKIRLLQVQMIKESFLIMHLAISITVDVHLYSFSGDKMIDDDESWYSALALIDAYEFLLM